MANFKITGEYYTNNCRSLWAQGDYKDAFELLTNAIPEMTKDQQIELIEYKMKLVGDSSCMDFIKETENRPDDYPTFNDVMGMVQTSRDLVEESDSKHRNTAMEIIDNFRDQHLFRNSDLHYFAKQWMELPKHITMEHYQGELPTYMVMYLRHYQMISDAKWKEKYALSNSNSIGYFGNRIPTSILSIVFNDASYFNELYCTKKGRDEFDRVCDDLFIFGETRDITFNTLKNYYKLISSDNPREQLIPVEKKELVKTKEMKASQFGWISPDGWYYPCYYTKHIELADRICEEMNIDIKHSESNLEGLGWYKIHMRDTDNKILFSGVKERTKMQQKRWDEYVKFNKINEYE